MEVAKLRAPLASLLAGLAALWALLRRLRSQRPRSGSPFPTGPTGQAAAGQGAAGAPPETPAAPEPVAAPAAGEPQAPEAPRRAARAPPRPPAPPPEAQAREVTEDPLLQEHVGAFVGLHVRGRITIDTAAGIETSYIPAASEQKSATALALSRSHLLAFVGTVEILGLAVLALSMVGAVAASYGILLVCVLVGIVGILIPATSSGSPGGSSTAADALHAVAEVQCASIPAVWDEVVAWVSKVPDGYRRGLAWRNQVAFLVEVSAEDSSEQQAFVLEPAGPLRVHHYVVRGGPATAADAPEAAWGLRAFLARAESGEGIVAEDGHPRGIQGTGAPRPRSYKRVRVVLSTKETYRITELSPMELQEGVAGLSQEPSIFVSPRNRASKPWLGFGGSFTESAAHVFAKMPPEKQEEVLHAYFNPWTGAGYTIGRMSIASCDFGLGNWMCGSLKDEDHKLTDLSIEHYLKEILPLYHRAVLAAGRPLWMLASPWSPPPWMKTKRQWNGDAHLRQDCQRTWADHFVRFVKEMAEAKVHIMAVSVQNEPEAAQIWESCVYTPEEERDFVRDHLGPALSEAGLASVKVLIWDHNRDGMFERAQVAYADPEAAKYIWGCAYHWYGDAHFESWPDRNEIYFPDRQIEGRWFCELRGRLGLENLRRVAELRPDKHILFTEGCQELSGTPLASVQNEWIFGERYAMNIIADMNSGCEGWIDWNLFLNERGGPNHVENNCLAPIIYDTQKQEVVYTPAYIFLNHFSRFIRPGARRVLSSTSRDVLEVTSFANADDSIVVVVLNRSVSQIGFKLKVAGEGTDPARFVQLKSPPSSILTLVIE